MSSESAGSARVGSTIDLAKQLQGSVDGFLPKDLQDAVETGFHFLQDKPGDDRSWARDWVFGYRSDGSGDITSLSNSVAFGERAVGTFDAVVNMPTLSGVAAWGVDTAYSWIPVLSLRGLTAGIVIERITGREGCAAIGHFPAAGKDLFIAGRFVQSQLTGEMLALTSSFSTHSVPFDSVVFFHIRNETSQIRRHACLHCDRSALSETAQDASSFLAAAVTGEFSLGQRTCSSCGASGPYQSCVCRMPEHAASSPLDFSSLRKVAKFNSGVVSAVANMFIRTSLGIPFSRILLPGTMNDTVRSSDDTTILCSSLRDLVIQDRIGRSRVPRSPVPSANFSGADFALSAVNPLGSVTHVGMSFSDVGELRTSPVDEIETLVASLSSSQRSNDQSDSSGTVVELRSSEDFPGSNITCSLTASEVALVLSSEDTAIIDGGSSAPTSSLPSGLSPKELERLERKRRRIESNRLAAARSNLRRRQYRDGLRRDLEEVKARQSELLKREGELRKYNQELKAQAAERLRLSIT